MELLWDSFWNKHADTSERGGEEKSPVERTHGSRKASTLALVCIPIYILKLHCGVDKQGTFYRSSRGNQQAAEGTDPLFRLFLQGILVQVAREITLGT